MTTRDAIRDALTSARDERDRLARQIDALDETIRSLENAETSLADAAPSGSSGGRRSTGSRNPRKTAGTTSKGRSTAKKQATAKKRTSSRSKTVSADRLVTAVTDLGGTATTDQVKRHLGITDGRLLTGARTQAVSQDRLLVDGGTLRAADTDTKATPKGASGATDSKTTSTGG